MFRIFTFNEPFVHETAAQIEILENPMGNCFLYLHKLNQTTLAVNELKNQVGLIVVINLFQDLLLDLLHAVRFRPLVIRTRTSWPKCVFKRLYELGFSEKNNCDDTIPGSLIACTDDTLPHKFQRYPLWYSCNSYNHDAVLIADGDASIQNYRVTDTDFICVSLKNNPISINPFSKKTARIINEFSLLSINVEAYLEGTQIELQQRIEETKAQIVCVQEDLQHGIHFKNRVTCKTGEMQLANSIYTQFPIHISDNLDIQSDCPVGRCGVMLQVLNNLKIATVHLCGGRFDDKNFTRLQHVKTKQLRKVVETWHPDIIAGDFNGEPNSVSLKTHPVYKELNPVFKRIYEKYHSDGHAYLLENGYVSALNSSLKPTSRFGGNPDNIYFKPDIVVLKKISIIDFLDLTDHNGIFATFQLV